MGGGKEGEEWEKIEQMEIKTSEQTVYKAQMTIPGKLKKIFFLSLLMAMILFVRNTGVHLDSVSVQPGS